eukprot:TRINITY_DN31374_c0_g1_i3.p2 TRINITY_DN31374_c0_g1~~TRINITY_DN31374_c0_g1_i3.p2  ORF type:complete len:120 (-),score=1.93 TRINITY_DN31374_c0_g1_i3:349-708(-)
MEEAVAAIKKLVAEASVEKGAPPKTDNLLGTLFKSYIAKIPSVRFRDKKKEKLVDCAIFDRKDADKSLNIQVAASCDLAALAKNIRVQAEWPGAESSFFKKGFRSWPFSLHTYILCKCS